jgi:hypothetical protein
MLLIYSSITGNRWNYISGFIIDKLAGYNLQITKDEAEYRSFAGASLNYSPQRLKENEFHIVPHTLLSETDITEQDIDVVTYNGKPSFFHTSSSADFSFDIFAASFYLLSRYEEYLPYEKDEYGRYAHTQSLACRENFLNRPLINEWVIDLKSFLQNRFPLERPRENVFCFMPTYDIDIAFSFLHKGWKSAAGSMFKSLLKFDFAAIARRMRVYARSENDPFDVYEWLYALHLKYGLKPNYFFLVAAKRKGYDKHILPAEKAMQDLITFHAMGYPIGIHPSWQSGDDKKLLHEEKKTLEDISGKTIQSSRQHYIRFELPNTFRNLIELGITKDFSMGYGSINGFRASVASVFPWFDLAANEETRLTLYPFCFMDANSYYEQKQTPAQAFEEIKYYHDTVKKVKGVMITIWHNNFFGSDPAFKGWKEVYELFLEEVVYWDI